MNNNLLIFGAGGHGRVVKEAAEALEIFSKIDFLDDNSELAIGKFEEYEKFVDKYRYAFVALGNPELRSMWSEKLSTDFYIPAIIHPTAYVSPSAQLGTGCFIGAKAVINTKTVIKNGCIVGIGALIDHDSVVEEYSYINAGVIVKAGSKVNSFTEIDEGKVYFRQEDIKVDKCVNYSFEVGM
jgi:UDP-3-O-[3-hydroxymyristoyl] glucosamine N-acyltransferase